MRRYIHRLVHGIALTALFLGSCAHARFYPGQTYEHTHIARIWVQDDPLVPKSIVLEACRYWEPKGLLCALVSKPEHANVEVHADPVACGQGGSAIEPAPAPSKQPGCVELLPAAPAEHARAEAWHDDGRIVIFTSCTAPSGVLDTDGLLGTLAHEIGHQLGIWDHVPTICDACGQVTKTGPDGRKLCGTGAIMNRSSTPGIESITALDSLAFDLRDEDRSPIERLDSLPRPTPRQPRSSPVAP